MNGCIQTYCNHWGLESIQTYRYYWGYKSDHMGVGIPAQVSNVLHGPVVLIPTLLCNIAIKTRYKKLKDILSAVVKKGKLCVHLFYKFDSAFMSYWMVNASYRFGTWIIFFSLLYFMKMYFWLKKDHLFNSFISLL